MLTVLTVAGLVLLILLAVVAIVAVWSQSDWLSYFCFGHFAVEAAIQLIVLCLQAIAEALSSRK